MPIQVRIEGRRHIIPDNQPYTVRVGSGKYCTYYQFSLPHPEVVVSTWRDKAYGYNESPQQILQDEKLISIKDIMYTPPLRGNERQYKYCEERQGRSRQERVAALFPEAVLEGVDKGKGTMVELITGTRVKVGGLGLGRHCNGTIVELKNGLPRKLVLVCMDLPHPDNQDLPEVCGEEHGLLVPQDNLRPLKAMNDLSLYKDVPPHIGMYAPESFSFQHRKFPRGSLGRVAQIQNGHTTLTWLNVPGLNQFYVPTELLQWCWFDPETFKVKRTWYSTRTTFENGETLVYWGEKPTSIHRDDDVYAITKGVLLKNTGYSAETGHLGATILSGMPKEILGSRGIFRKQDVKKFEGVFIPQASEVEIVADVMFKKQSLKGRRGKVILATDFEGDIGVQFPDDIGAGSLDGAGKEGKCLYIPVDSVKIIS